MTVKIWKKITKKDQKKNKTERADNYVVYVENDFVFFSSSWEIPALKSGKLSIVSDSDGISYPWYGNSTEIATIVGPTDSLKQLHLSVRSDVEEVIL